VENLLKCLDAVLPLSTQLVDHFMQILKVKTVSKKQYLLKAGHICRNIYFIEQGLLRCFYLNNDIDVSTWFMKEGDVIISIESFYQQKESYEYIQALEDCVLCYITHAELQYIYNNFIEFNFNARLLTEKYYTLWAQQLYAIRMQPSHVRYKWLLENHGDLILRVPAKYIASYLGITEVTLSNIKGKKYIS